MFTLGHIIIYIRVSENKQEQLCLTNANTEFSLNQVTVFKQIHLWLYLFYILHSLLFLCQEMHVITCICAHTHTRSPTPTSTHACTNKYPYYDPLNKMHRIKTRDRWMFERQLDGQLGILANLQSLPPHVSDGLSSLWNKFVLNDLFQLRQHLGTDQYCISSIVAFTRHRCQVSVYNISSFVNTLRGKQMRNT